MPKPQRAFDDLVHELYAAVLRMAFLILGDDATARDVAQETFARMYSRWPHIREYDRLDAYARRTAARLAIKEVGRRQRVQPTDLVPDTSTRTFPPDLDVQNAILKLPPMQRAAVVLTYFEDRSAEDIGTLIGCAPSTVRVHLHRARSRLAQLLSEEVPDVC